MFIVAFVSSIYAESFKLIKRQPIHKPKMHPYVNILQSQPYQIHNDRKALTNNKLLVILVDFQEESPDDPSTTGNGKFLLSPDPSYRTTIASPPHNQEYFEANLNALRYYYLAASQNDFNLQYDVYPKDQPAYTLPHAMSYYSQTGAGSELFVARIEEYFKESFELADSLDPEIDFSQYHHFMIIHAGSDWQHDVFGDTPSDLPSFFIKVSDGKEAIVDNGTVLVDQACNVPSTISQDFDTYDIDGTTYYTGYGALNGVMAHEFGHSLGLVDLYNVYNFSPMVGQFDIMDSGGAGVTEDFDSPGVLIEGELPSLPGAFSRMLMFKDSFQQRGLYKELNQILSLNDLSDVIQISASSQKQQSSPIIPNIIKIPLNEHEYILVENRSVDPDNDGGTAIQGDLNRRVALYPTAIDNPADTTATYEYDYLLPSFIDEDYRAIGGGILVWHVDEKVLFEQGLTNSDGIFVSNFENNSVNYSLSHRGVRVLEADGLDDLGNPYSWFWTGTPYEYFHKYKPSLDQNGFFQNWTTQLWHPELNSISKPSLTDYQNQPSFYGLKDISQPMAEMTFKLSAGIFDSIKLLGNADTLQIPLPLINSNLAEHVLPVLKNSSIHFYLYDPGININAWEELIAPLSLGLNSIDFEPVIADFNNNGYKELVIPQINKLYVIEYDDDVPVSYQVVNNTGHPFTTSPLFAFGKLYAATESAIYLVTDNQKSSLNPVDFIGGAFKLAASDDNLVILQKNKLLIVEPQNYLILTAYNLPDFFTKYEPIVVKEPISGEYTYVLMSDRGNIYTFTQNKVSMIFHNAFSDNNPTNPAVSSLGDYSPCIIFGVNDQLYAIKMDGTLLPGYPVYLEGYQSKPYSHTKVRFDTNASLNQYAEIVYLQLIEGGYVAVNAIGMINKISSMIDIKAESYNQTYYLPNEDKLFWFFNNNDGNLFAAELDNQPENPFIWTGFRNGNTGQINLGFYQPNSTSTKIKAYAFPNPVKNNRVTIRVENPDGDVKLNIYDIAGKLLYKNKYTSEYVSYKDFQIDVSKYSSGVYLVTVESNSQIRRIKFAKEK